MWSVLFQFAVVNTINTFSCENSEAEYLSTVQYRQRSADENILKPYDQSHDTLRDLMSYRQLDKLFMLCNLNAASVEDCD